MKKRFLLLFVFVGLFITSLAQAQVATKKKVEELTDEEVTLFFQKAQASGMSEAQIESAAKAQGYTAADIARMRERISKTNVTGTKTSDESSTERVVNGEVEKDEKKAVDNTVDKIAPKRVSRTRKSSSSTIRLRSCTSS